MARPKEKQEEKEVAVLISNVSRHDSGKYDSYNAERFMS